MEMVVVLPSVTLFWALRLTANSDNTTIKRLIFGNLIFFRCLEFNNTQNYKNIRRNKTPPPLYAPPPDNSTHNQPNSAIF